MRWLKRIICKFVGGCCVEDAIKYGFVVPEGNAVVAAVYRDKSERLALNVSRIEANPGETVLITSKEDFSIHFKKGDSPTGKLGYTKKNGVVAVEIPEDILGCDWRDYKGEPKVFEFDVSVGDETLDPPIIIPRKTGSK